MLSGMEGAEDDTLAAVCPGSEPAALGMQPVDDERLEAAAQAVEVVVQSRMTTHRKSKACQSSSVEGVGAEGAGGAAGSLACPHGGCAKVRLVTACLRRVAAVG